MMKILIIEDEDMLRGEVVEWLTFEGYEVFSAKDGVAGLECSFGVLPDLIVCDIMMPRLDGYGVLLEMRSNPETATIPFIFMTAKVTPEDIRRGMVLGADDYLTKPFERLDLLQSIQTRLAKKAMLEQSHQHDVEQLQTALEQEHEQRLLKAKMVAMFSHDFRNPLTNIMTSISLVRDYADRLGEQGRLKHLNHAEASVRQLMQMLDDMLVVSQMENGNLDFKPEQLNIEAFIQRMVEEFQTLHGETHPLIFESRFNGTTMVDPHLLHQIATNLISNAIKYSPKASEVGDGRLLFQTTVSSQPYHPTAQAGKIGPAVCPNPVETAVYPQPTNQPGAAMKDHAFQVAINQKYRDKVKPGDGRFWKFNMTFQTTRLTLPKLLVAIRQGYAWTAPHRRIRHHRPRRANPTTAPPTASRPT
jgi:two-component system, sensor histidine kinase and response regulator